MPTVVIVDTSVFLNVLAVPGFDQDREAVLAELKALLEDNGVSLLLPMAAIIEAGNHIAQLSDGGNRRRFAEAFAAQIQAAISGDAPWVTTQLPESEAILGWLGEFPDHAMREIGMGDLSIIKDWEAACIRHPIHRVRIWSHDGALSAYDREP